MRTILAVVVIYGTYIGLFWAAVGLTIVERAVRRLNDGGLPWSYPSESNEDVQFYG